MWSELKKLMQSENVNVRITVTGRHVEVTEAMRDYANKKVEGLHLDYPRIIEAKVIRTDGAVSEYANEIRDNFLTGRYSTFSSEAAMLGYLLSGTEKNAFDAIEKALDSVLNELEDFQDREHRYSSHTRNLRSGAGTSTDFRCHHLLMHFG